MITRQRVYIDSKVQGVLLGRVVFYWALSVLYVALSSLCFQYYEHPQWTASKHFSTLFAECWPWLPSVILILPLASYDIVRLSNRFAGPIYRLRQQLRDLHKDPNCRPLGFREDDYWPELAVELNALQTAFHVKQLEMTPATVADEPQEEPREVVDADFCEDEAEGQSAELGDASGSDGDEVGRGGFYSPDAESLGFSTMDDEALESADRTETTGEHRIVSGSQDGLRTQSGTLLAVEAEAS